MVGEVTVTNSTDNVYRYLGYENTLDTIFDKLVDRLGGELRVRKENGIRYLDYLQEIGEVKSTEIRLSRNLKSVQKEVDPSEIITRLIPLGQSIESADETATDASQARLTIAEVNNGKDYIEDSESRALFGVVTKSQAWDDVTQPSILMSKGKDFLKENNRVKVKYSISALDLSLIGLDTDSFDVYNYYPVINPIMSINETLRVVEKTTDIINPNTNSLSVGDVFKTSSQYQNEANKAKQNVVNLQNTVSKQIIRIGALSTDLENAKNHLNSTKEILTKYQELTDQDIISITNSIDSVLASINDLNQLIEDLQSVVSVEEIQQMQTDISNNASAIESVNSAITTINTAIQDLTNRVSALESKQGGV